MAALPISKPTQPTKLTSYGVVDPLPTLTYGNETGEVAFRLGNGGSGPTGILRRLAEDFLDLHAPGQSVPWVCNHSRNTQLALHQGHIDLSMTYERDFEKIAADEGWSVDKGIVFHDHFVVAGPRHNPAKLSFSDSPADCFRKIHAAASKGLATFHSRADGSATMIKERQIWALTGLPSPWTDPAAKKWYKMTTVAPAAALIGADQEGAYLLSDRSTLLRQTADETISMTTVFYEPKNSKDLLMNSCAMTTAPSPPPLATKFIEYALSERAQAIIKDFGTTETGAPFFARVSDGFAKPVLRGGFPAGGKWRVVRTKL